MLGAYVCRKCLAHLPRRAALVRNPQWQSRATFISLNSPKSQPNTKPDEKKAESTPQEKRSLAQKITQGEPDARLAYQRQRPPVRTATRNRTNIHGTGTNWSEQQAPVSRYSGLLDSDAVNNPFYAGYGQEDTLQEAEPQEAPSHRLTYAAPIREAIGTGQIQKAWDLFQKTYTAKDCKTLTEPALPDELSNQELVFSRLLGAVTGAFRSGRADVHVTPTAVLCRYQQLGIARPGHWVRPTLASLTHEVVQAVNLPSAKPRQDLQSLLHEIISLWRLFFQCMGPESDAFESISDDWSLPPLEELPDMYDSRDFNFRLQKHIPKYVSSPALGFCAVYLYSISDALDPTIHEKAAPFLRFLERLLAGSRVDSIFVHTESSQQFKVLPVDIQRQIRGEIDAAPRKALIALGKVGESPDEMTNLEAFHMKSIARVVESMTSRSKLDKIWEEVQQTYLTENKRVAIPRSVYNRFLSGYLVLYNSNRAVEVWNHMIAHGVQPDVQSWVALLEGCAKTKDLNGFNTTWQRMLNSGIEPENYAWTTRVNGLMSFRQINPALATLDDMGKRWLAAEQAINNTKTHNKGQRGSTRAVNRCTKPSIEVVNGAISAIVQIRPESLRHEKRVEYVQKILAWSTNFQIKPDAITYNSLIRLYLQAKDMRTAFRLLTQMEKDGVEADIATHTMLMSTAFENQVFDGQTEQQQTERILRMLDDLEANGLRLNHYVYSTAIDRVLKGYANYTAVRAIMEHMTSRNFTPSAHVYTSLITHYFQSEPPNLVEVDNVVNLLFTAPRMPSDRILYDRLIEGYALNSEVGKMMSVLTRMSKQGVLPGWGALIAVVQALVREGDYDRARDVVRDVARGEGVAKGGIMMDRTSEMAFRSLVNRLGLDEERMGDFMAGGRQRNSDSVVQHFTTERRVLDSPAQQEHASSGYANDDAAVGEDIHGFLAREHEPGLWG